MSLNKAIIEVVDLLGVGVKQETLQNHTGAHKTLNELYTKDPGNFLEIVQFALDDFNTLVKSALDVPVTDESYILDHITSGLYKHFHTERAEKLEGSSCSYDKSSFIEAMTIKALKTEENLSLYNDYKNVDEIKEDKERQAYWSPRTVKDTDEAMELFWKWYQLIE